MTKKSGFTLIELLLVLAIIGIISAIAIPALLGQRARARDKSTMANCSSIVPDLVAVYDKAKDNAAAPANLAALTGTASAPTVPAFFSAKNPWDATTAAYLATTATVVSTDGGAAVSAANTTRGLTTVGYLAPAAGANGIVVASAYLNTATNGSQHQTVTAGLD